MEKFNSILFTTIVLGLKKLDDECEWDLSDKDISKMAESLHNNLIDKPTKHHSHGYWKHIFNGAMEWCYGKDHNYGEINSAEIMFFTHDLQWELE